MNVNIVGKTLVLLNGVLSLLFLAWALGIFTQQFDWGKMDPRKELGELVPSEIDKHAAALQEAMKAKSAAEAGLANAQTGLDFLGNRLPFNRLWYREELARLQTSPDKIVIKEIKLEKGSAVVDPKDSRPVLENVVTFTDADKKVIAVEKSLESYRGDLKKVLTDLDDLTEKIKKIVEQQKEMTVKLNGVRDEEGKLSKPGLYALLEAEHQAQKQVQEEVEYLRPLWVREQVDAELLLERRRSLEARLAELKGVLAAKRQ